MNRQHTTNDNHGDLRKPNFPLNRSPNVMLLTTATQRATTNGSSLIHEETDILNSRQIYNPLMRFIGPNWETNSTHQSQDRVSETHDPRFLGLGWLEMQLNNPCHIPHLFNPTPSCWRHNKKVTKDIHDDQHESTFPLDSWLNPVTFMITGEG